MAVFLAVIDLLKAAAWPIAVAFVAIWYKDEVNKHLPRVRKAGPAGVELDAIVQQRSVELTTISSGDLKEIPGHKRTPLIEEVEKELHQRLRLIGPSLQTDVMAGELAVARIALVIERIYRLIFRSQIVGLRQLRATGPVSLDQAREFFEPYRIEHADFYKDYGFEGWLNFLEQMLLVRRVNDTLTITERGTDCIVYMDAAGLSEAGKIG